MEEPKLFDALSVFSADTAPTVLRNDPPPQVVHQGSGELDAALEPGKIPELGDVLERFSPGAAKLATAADPAPAQTDATPSAAADSSADAFPETIQGDEKAQAKWGELRKSLKTMEDKLKEYESRPAAQQDESVVRAFEQQIAEREAKLQEYDEYFRMTRVEFTQEYQQLVEQPLTAIAEATEELAQRYGVNADALTDALAERDPKKQDEMLTDLIADFSPRDRNRLYNLADSAIEIYAKAESIRQHSAQALAEVEAREAADAQRAAFERGQVLTKANQEVLGMAEAKLAALGIDFAPIRPQVEAARIDTATPQEQAYATVAAAVLPQVLKTLNAQSAKVKELEASLSALNRAAPAGQAVPAESQGSALATNPAIRVLMNG